MLVSRTRYFRACFQEQFEESKTRIVKWPEESLENANAVAQWSNDDPIPGLGMLEGAKEWQQFLELAAMANERCLDVFLTDMCLQQSETIMTDWRAMDKDEIEIIVDAVRKFRQCPAVVAFQTDLFGDLLEESCLPWEGGAFGSLLLYVPLYRIGTGGSIERVECHRLSLYSTIRPDEYTARALLYLHSPYQPDVFVGEEDGQDYWKYLVDIWKAVTTQTLDLEYLLQYILTDIGELERDNIERWDTFVLILRIADRVPDTGIHMRFHDAILKQITKECKSIITPDSLTSGRLSERISHRLLNHYILHG